jgi:hypothetical protein
MRRAIREAMTRAGVCGCDPTRSESCPVDDGQQAETDEYWSPGDPDFDEAPTSSAQRRKHDRSAGRWWLCTTAQLPEGHQPRPVDDRPREDHA